MDFLGASFRYGALPAAQRGFDPEGTGIAGGNDLPLGRDGEQHRIGEAERMGILDGEDRGDITPTRATAPRGVLLDACPPVFEYTSVSSTSTLTFLPEAST